MTLHEILRDITHHLHTADEKSKTAILDKIDEHEQQTAEAAAPVDEQPASAPSSGFAAGLDRAIREATPGITGGLTTAGGEQ